MISCGRSWASEGSMKARRKLLVILLTYLLMEGCVIGFSLSYRNWVQHTDVITKTGLCTGIVWHESRFSFKTSSLPFAMLRFDDGSEYLGGECMAGKLPRELTIGYVSGWRIFQYLPVVSITDGETVYLTFEEWQEEQIADSRTDILFLSACTTLLALLVAAWPAWQVISDVRVRHRRAKKKAARKVRLEAKQRKESEGLK